MNINLIPKNPSKYHALLFSLVLAGYPFTVGVASFFADDTRVASIVVRALYLLLLLVFLIFSVSSSNKPLVGKNLRLYTTCMVLFLVCYSLRVISEVNSRDLYVEPMQLLLTLFLGTIPTIFAFSSRTIVPNTNRVVNFLFKFMLIALVLLLFHFSVQSNFNFGALVQGRLSIEKLNPISFGMMGANIVVLAIYLFFEKIMFVRWKKSLFAFAAVTGLIALIMSGSRSPLLATAVSLFLYFAATYKQRPRLSRIVFLFLFLTLAYLVAEFLSRYTSISFFNRLGVLTSGRSLSDDLSILSRLLSFSGGFEQFLSSPIFGSSIVEKNTGFYPHNIFIESLMATGLVGTTFLIIAIGCALRSVAKLSLKYSPYFWVVLLFVQYFILFQFSGSVWTAAALFALMGVVVAADNARSV